MPEAPKTRRRWLQFGLGTLFLLVALIAYLGIPQITLIHSFLRDGIWNPNTGYRFPDVLEISSLRVNWWNGSGSPKHWSFTIPQNRWADILAALSPSEEIPDRKMTGLGELTLVTNEGSTISVPLFVAAPWPPVASFYIQENGRRKVFRGGSYEGLVSAIEAAYKEATGIDSEGLSSESEFKP
jgi:hypothetical protein